MNYQLFETIGLTGLDISIVLLVMTVLILACFLITIVSLTKYSKLNKKYKKAKRAQIKRLYEKQKLHYQKIGMHKYDAFQEMGGQLSFALTLLDENNDGFILNSVHNIQSSYCYIKEVKNGTCNINLSKDEAISLEKALKQTSK